MARGYSDVQKSQSHASWEVVAGVCKVVSDAQNAKQSYKFIPAVHMVETILSLRSRDVGACLHPFWGFFGGIKKEETYFLPFN